MLAHCEALPSPPFNTRRRQARRPRLRTRAHSRNRARRQCGMRGKRRPHGLQRADDHRPGRDARWRSWLRRKRKRPGADHLAGSVEQLHRSVYRGEPVGAAPGAGPPSNQHRNVVDWLHLVNCPIGEAHTNARHRTAHLNSCPSNRHAFSGPEDTTRNAQDPWSAPGRAPRVHRHNAFTHRRRVRHLYGHHPTVRVARSTTGHWCGSRVYWRRAACGSSTTLRPAWPARAASHRDRAYCRACDARSASGRASVAGRAGDARAPSDARASRDATTRDATTTRGARAAEKRLRP